MTASISRLPTALPVLPLPIPGEPTPGALLDQLAEVQSALEALTTVVARLEDTAEAMAARVLGTADAEPDALAEAWHEEHIQPLIDALEGSPTDAALISYEGAFAAIAEVIPAWAPVGETATRLGRMLNDLVVRLSCVSNIVDGSGKRGDYLRFVSAR